MNQPSLLYRLMQKINPRIAANYQKGIGPTRVVLLLTTTGRKSGLPRVTPLQFEVIDGAYYVGSARGDQADWYRNIVANPRVQVQEQNGVFQGVAEPVCDPSLIADFFETRLKRHPFPVGLIMRLDGLPLFYTRADLERLAASKTLVIIRPAVSE